MSSLRNIFLLTLQPMSSLKLQKMVFFFGTAHILTCFTILTVHGSFVFKELHAVAASLSMWQFQGPLMNGQSTQKEYSIHGKGMKITHFASTLLKQLDAQWSTLALRTSLKEGYVCMPFSFHPLKQHYCGCVQCRTTKI